MKDRLIGSHVEGASRALKNPMERSRPPTKDDIFFGRTSFLGVQSLEKLPLRMEGGG
jgi:hypothetical protein